MKETINSERSTSSDADLSLKETVQRAKAEFGHAKSRLVRALETTPDDRLNWSPSSTSRTPLQLAAHCALSVHHMLGNMDGRTYAVPETAEADRSHRRDETQFTTREQVLDLLEDNSAKYFAWLDGLTPEKLHGPMTLPFNFGTIPVSAGIPFMALHMMTHVAQIEYIQTIYGDHDWHL